MDESNTSRSYSYVFFPVSPDLLTVSWRLVLPLFLVGLLVVGCQSLREAAQLRNVEFRIDRLQDAELSGIPLRSIRSYEDLAGQQVLRLASDVANDRLPLSFTLHLEATNPEGNNVNARLTAMNWTLLLDDREALQGKVDREVVMRPGEPTDLPIEMSLNVLEVFDESARAIVNRFSEFGDDRPPSSVKVQVQPTIQTPLGPIRYPEPITVGRKEV